MIDVVARSMLYHVAFNLTTACHVQRYLSKDNIRLNLRQKAFDSMQKYVVQVTILRCFRELSKLQRPVVRLDLMCFCRALSTLTRLYFNMASVSIVGTHWTLQMFQ